VLSHTEVFEDFENYGMELPYDISSTQTADTDESLVGICTKLNVD